MGAPHTGGAPHIRASPITGLRQMHFHTQVQATQRLLPSAINGWEAEPPRPSVDQRANQAPAMVGEETPEESPCTTTTGHRTGRDSH
jgi:hypothetical protein